MGVDNPLIEFRLDVRSGVPTYLQLVQQVKQALRLGILQPGDQLPTVKEVVAQLAINPNTVLKAYRELDRVSADVTASEPGDFDTLRAAFVKWIDRALDAGLDEEAIHALIAAGFRDAFFEDAA